MTEETPWTCTVRTALLGLTVPPSVCLSSLRILSEGMDWVVDNGYEDVDWIWSYNFVQLI